MRCEGDAEPLEDGGGARLERVAVVEAHHLLELGDAQRGRRRVGEMRCSVERIPDDAVAHHRHVEDDVLVAEEAVLAEHAACGPLGEADAAVGRGLVAREDR